MVGPGGADGSMLRVDASSFKPRGRRRLIVWLLLILLPIVGLLLGLLIPQGGATIELGSGALEFSNHVLEGQYILAESSLAGWWVG
ncbi:MAG: hypothetical protein OXD50_04025 [Chloroflexi bacterium]|nr:hypothetical protein [Chloroflexota bacterium]